MFILFRNCLVYLGIVYRNGPSGYFLKPWRKVLNWEITVLNLQRHGVMDFSYSRMKPLELGSLKRLKILVCATGDDHKTNKLKYIYSDRPVIEEN